MQTPETPQRWEERRKQKKAENPNLGDLHLPLEVAVQMWPTPQAADAERRGGDYARANGPNSGGDDLTTAAGRATWPTPDAHMHTGGRVRDTAKVSDTGQSAKGKRQITLNDSVRRQTATWATPSATDARGPGHGDQTRPTTLSPTWVEYLMGYPLGWTQTGTSHALLQQSLTGWTG